MPGSIAIRDPVGTEFSAVDISPFVGSDYEGEPDLWEAGLSSWLYEAGVSRLYELSGEAVWADK